MVGLITPPVKSSSMPGFVVLFYNRNTERNELALYYLMSWVSQFDQYTVPATGDPPKGLEPVPKLTAQQLRVHENSVPVMVTGHRTPALLTQE